MLGADIGGAVRAAVAAGHLVKGGGHAMAAGLTVARDKLALVEAFLHAKLAESVGEARTRDGLDIDGALTPGGRTDELLELIARVGPYGQGNPAPRFAFPATSVKFAKIVGENHVRCVLQSADGTQAGRHRLPRRRRAAGRIAAHAGGLPLHVAGNVKRSSCDGREHIELTSRMRPTRAARAEPSMGRWGKEGPPVEHDHGQTTPMMPGTRVPGQMKRSM